MSHFITSNVIKATFYHLDRFINLIVYQLDQLDRFINLSVLST